MNFELALQRGRGQVLQRVRAERSLVDEAAIRHALFHFVGINQQEEGHSRGRWMALILEAAGRLDAFRDEVMHALEMPHHGHSQWQLADLAAEYGKRGDAGAAPLLRTLVRREPGVSWFAHALLEIEGLEAVDWLLQYLKPEDVVVAAPDAMEAQLAHLWPYGPPAPAQPAALADLETTLHELARTSGDEQRAKVIRKLIGHADERLVTLMEPIARGREERSAFRAAQVLTALPTSLARPVLERCLATPTVDWLGLQLLTRHQRPGDLDALETRLEGFGAEDGLFYALADIVTAATPPHPELERFVIENSPNPASRRNVLVHVDDQRRLPADLSAEAADDCLEEVRARFSARRPADPSAHR